MPVCLGVLDPNPVMRVCRGSPGVEEVWAEAAGVAEGCRKDWKGEGLDLQNEQKLRGSLLSADKPLCLSDNAA